MLLLLNFSVKYIRLNHQKCLQFAPLDFCCGVGRKAIHPCTGFCGVMALLIALFYEKGNRLCMSPFFRYLLYFKLVSCDFCHTIVERRVWRITHDYTMISHDFLL